MLKLRKLASVMLVSGLLAASGAASAVTIGAGLVNGANQLIDESRETYVDVNGNGLFDAGDVVFGYIRISDFQPSGNTAGNQVYGVFSQQIAAGSAGRDVIFEATTAAGLTLANLLGNDANVTANAVAAFYDRPTDYVDLINTNPPGPPASMQGYLDYIANNGTLRIVAGLDGIDDFLYSEISAIADGLGIGIGSTNSFFLSPLVDAGFTVAANFGMLSLIYEDTPYDFNDIIGIAPAAVGGGARTGQVGISAGSVSGANGDETLPQPKNWLNAGDDPLGVAFAQCDNGAGGTTDCGFQNKNNFVVNVTRVPEPGTLALLGLSLAGLGVIRRRRA